MALHLATKIDIDASPEIVWAVREANGTLAAGERLREHRFTIEPTARGSRLVQEERFSGLLVPFLARSLRRGTLPGFERMNEALKERAEAQRARVAA